LALKPHSLTVQELADLALQHLVSNPEQLAEFMVQSGLEPTTLRQAMGTAGFRHGLIDYVVSNEPLLLAVAAANNLRPEAVMQAWAKLHHQEH
jgi:hypothetical protein